MKPKYIKKKTPWPTKEAMQQVYQDKLWGNNGTPFYSGEGSHRPELIQPYIEIVTNFLKSFKEPLTVCDLGCGDFNIGRQLVPYVKNYIAVDIVPELIDFNSKTFIHPSVEFRSLDIAKDDLPYGDCAILRQVLQHLSNAEVVQIVKKLHNFKYVILTEHLPKGNFIPNKDIISGQGIRLKKESGIDLLEAPFYLKVTEAEQLLSLNINGNQGVVETKMFKIH